MAESVADSSPVADRAHDAPWSANLERSEHADDAASVVEGALHAIDRTARGTPVTLVTHAAHGHPEAYLYEALREEYDGDVDLEYLDRCGCGGYVTTVTVQEE